MSRKRDSASLFVKVHKDGTCDCYVRHSGGGGSRTLSRVEGVKANKAEIKAAAEKVLGEALAMRRLPEGVNG